MNQSKLHVDFWNKIENDEPNINTEIFNEYFKYKNLAFLLKDLFNTDKTKNDKIVNNFNDAFIGLQNAVNRKKIPKNENPDKVIEIVEEILSYKK